MTWVKICGITNLEDAQTAIDAGADALGFVFYEKSPRYVEPASANRIIEQLPDTVEKVGVFAGDANMTVTEIFRTVQLTALQFHYIFDGHLENRSDNELRAYSMSPSQVKRFLMAFPAAWFQASNAQNVDLASFALLPEQAVLLLDSGNEKQPGGTGKTFDWHDLAPAIKTLSNNLKVVVAGGLTPANVSEALQILRPWGVDVSSGVEAKPGKKDPEKVRAFISAVRRAEKAI